MISFRPRHLRPLLISVPDISKHFALGMQYNGLYDAGPVVPIFKFYYSYSTTLLYKL